MRTLLLSAGMAAALLAQPARTGAAGLPPAPAPGASTSLAGVTLYLELVVNQQPTGQVVPVVVRDGHYHVAADVLRALHVRTPTTGADLVAVDRIEGVGVRYDSVAQRLELALPPHWLPAQQLGDARPNRVQAPTGRPSATAVCARPLLALLDALGSQVLTTVPRMPEQGVGIEDCPSTIHSS